MSDPLARLRAILPDGAVAAGGPISHLQEPLLPGEDQSLHRARDTRRADFIAGRTAARRALAALGLPAHPLPRDPRGPVLWPEGVTGSISHGAGWALAALAPSRDLAGIGIDIEAAGSFVPLEDIALPDEINALGERDPVLLFSAKESAYKAQFPLTGRMFGFHDLRIIWTDYGFTAEMLLPGPKLTIRGGWVVTDAVVVTMAAIHH